VFVGICSEVFRIINIVLILSFMAASGISSWVEAVNLQEECLVSQVRGLILLNEFCNFTLHPHL
jgi:hypothetical protein